MTDSCGFHADHLHSFTRRSGLPARMHIMNMPTTFTTFALLSLSHGASALQVDPSQMLMQLSSVLNEVFTPIESTASSLASYVKAGPQPMVTPSPAEAGMVRHTPRALVLPTVLLLIS
jgi:hypothetical protein